jgi:hypothetical protein
MIASISIVKVRNGKGAEFERLVADNKVHRLFALYFPVGFGLEAMARSTGQAERASARLVQLLQLSDPSGGASRHR